MDFTNSLKTLLLVSLLTALFMFIGYLVGGQGGALIAFGIAAVINVTSYWFSDKIVLRMYGATEIQYSENPRLYSIVQRLAQQAGLPMPKVYLIPTDTPNAFATGRNPEHAAVAATEGILNRLSDDELEGVMAHELGHVRNRDILISSLVATLAGAISYIATMAQWSAIFGFGRNSDDDDRGSNPIALLAMAIVAPIAAMLIQMAISRSREFMADRAGAEISRRPMSLASALIKLEKSNKMLPMPSSNATAHLFIVNPLSGGGFGSLFRTHPTTEERVARLEEYSRQTGLA
ncbi:MAG: zinc metalloprotease HtpX [Bacteroidetes bacterium]|nr:zinc metalloprotease HtpX [Bacteroidota bacterium]